MRVVLVPAFTVVALLTTTSVHAQDEVRPGAGPVPAVVVQVGFTPEGRASWREAFEAHVAPAIRRAIDAGEIRGFAYYEAIVPGQPYDFMLILHAPTFAFFDRRRPYPHYAALFESEGLEEGRRILAEMARWETDVSVSLVRGFGGLR